MALAIFDLDNTLLDGDSDHAWGEFLVRKGIVDGAEYRAANDRFYREYQNGTLDIHSYLSFALQPLTRHSADELRELHAEFMRTMIAPMRLPKADALLAEHRARGDFLLIITATNAFITRPIADSLGVDAILATEPEVIGGRHTGNIVGSACFREGKVTCLDEWLQAHPYDLRDASFYSDSQNDLPLLNKVGKPVAVDPDDMLRAAAIENGWPVISLRN
ncbi:MAG: HAD-superfamily subfamily hydrolase [Verrucomicrobiaceae bacterium]|nr:HAD-superfamily subfamily hydrolase [Verrucomicrobiaceae bacterium]